jgi:4-hydroxybenzoate polyprenyltransferase
MMELFKALRPQQWIKNLFIFAPLIFSQNIFNRALVVTSALAFVAFCLVSSAHYLFNDLRDLEEDRLHPLKSKRPLAAGRLKKGTAVAAMVVLGPAGLLLAAAINLNFFLITVAYLVLQVAYSLWLKHVVILDVFVVAAGFLIRVVAGGLAIRVFLSSWLLICTTLLALFLAMGKRRHELVILEQNATSHRPILREYNIYLLDQMISVVTASTLVAYCLYTISDETVTSSGAAISSLPCLSSLRHLPLPVSHPQKSEGEREDPHPQRRRSSSTSFLWVAAAACDPQHRVRP